MDNHNAAREIAKPDAAQPANDAIQAAATLAYDAGYSPRQAVTVIDDSRAAKEMFPGDEQRENAAYRIMMHDQQMKGYPSVQFTDLNRFSDAQTGEIQNFAATSRPSVNPAKVEKAEAELARMGFPKVTHQ